MGYDIRLLRNNSRSKIKDAKLKDLPRGSMFKVFPPWDANKPVKEGDLFLTITVNYTWYFKETIDKKNGLLWINGKKGREVLPVLRKALSEIAAISAWEIKNKKIKATVWNEPYDAGRMYGDYWYCCGLNAGKAIEDLIQLIEIAPYFTIECLY